MPGHTPSRLQCGARRESLDGLLGITIDGMAADFPESMSEVLGSWLWGLDGVLDDPETTREWEILLPLAAATGRELEQERLSRIVDWMWEKVLPSLQSIMDAKEMWIADPERLGGEMWRMMCWRRADTSDFSAYASVYGGVDHPVWIAEHYRAAALAAAEAALAAGIAERAASKGEFAEAASAAGHVAFAAANAHGAGRGIEAAKKAEEAAARGLSAETDNFAHMNIPQQVGLTRRVLGEVCSEAYAAACPVGRAKFWDTVKPRQLLMQLAEQNLGRRTWWPWGRP